MITAVAPVPAAAAAQRGFVRAVDEATAFSTEALGHLDRSAEPVTDPFGSPGFMAQQRLQDAADALQQGARVFAPGDGLVAEILLPHARSGGVNTGNIPLVFTGAVHAARGAEQLLDAGSDRLRAISHSAPVPPAIATDVRALTLDALERLESARRRAFA